MFSLPEPDSFTWALRAPDELPAELSAELFAELLEHVSTCAEIGSANFWPLYSLGSFSEPIVLRTFLLVLGLMLPSTPQPLYCLLSSSFTAAWKHQPEFFSQFSICQLQ